MALDLAAVIRQGVALASNLTTSLQVTVKHYVKTGRDSNGYTYASPVNVSCLLEMKNEVKLQVSTGKIIHTKAKLTFLRSIVIGENDKLILPDGTTGPIHKAEGFVDPASTGPNPFVTEVWLGT